MITTNVYNRVFFIRAEQYGTAFTIDVDGKQYLISARHVVGTDENRKSLLVYLKNQWNELPIRIVGISKGEVDIAVLATDINLSGDFPLPSGTKGMVVGQDVYFVGYPYKMWTDGGQALAGRPCPFIKKGTWSSFTNTGDGIERLYIDAINNEGFSGGPVDYCVPGKRDFKVAGVVYGFKTENEPVLDSEGEPTGMTVAYNTGFMLAYGISHALKIIESNPVGHKI